MKFVVSARSPVCREKVPPPPHQQLAIMSFFFSFFGVQRGKIDFNSLQLQLPIEWFEIRLNFFNPEYWQKSRASPKFQSSRSKVLRSYYQEPSGIIIMGCCVSKNPPVHQTQREAGAGGQKQEIAHGPGGHRQQLPPDHGIVNHQLHHDIGGQIHNNRGDGEMKKKAVAAASAASAATVKPIRKSSRITAASCDIQNNAPLHPTAPLHGKRINFGYGRDFDEKYSLGKLLGHGQFGYTYVGTEKATSNKVAVKCIEKKKVSLFCRIRRVTHLTLLLRASPSHFLQSFQGLKIKHFSSRLVPIWKECQHWDAEVLEQFLVHSKMHNLIDAGGLLEESILECTVWVQEVQEKQHIAWWHGVNVMDKTSSWRSS